MAGRSRSPVREPRDQELLPPRRKRPGRSWTPPLKGELAAQARASLVECVQGLYERSFSADGARGDDGPSGWDSPGLYDGHAGLALLWYHLLETPTFVAQAGFRESDIEDRLRSATDATLDAVSSTPMSLRLFDGLAGHGWLLSYLAERLSPNVAGLLADIDALLRDSIVDADPQFEFFTGLGGITFYLCARQHEDLNISAIARAARSFGNAAIRQNGACVWSDPATDRWSEDAPPAASSSLGRVNLGMPHGMAGMAAILGLVSRSAVPSATKYLVSEMLRDLSAWLLDQRRATTTDDRFPAVVRAGGAPIPSTVGLRWCYGDMSVASGLLSAGVASGRGDLVTAATEIATQVAETGLTPATATRETCLCHGTAGVAHMFARMYSLTGKERFLDASTFWWRRTLDIRVPGDFIGGYAVWRRGSLEDDGQWVERLTFLDGTVGVALALLSALEPVEPRWDRLLLLSVA